MNDKFDAIGQLEDELARSFADLAPHWEVHGADPVLTVRAQDVELRLVPQDDGRVKLETTVAAEQVAQVLSLLTGSGTAPAASGHRTRSRRLASMGS